MRREQLRAQDGAVRVSQAADALDGHAIVERDGGNLPFTHIRTADKIDGVAVMDRIARHGIAVCDEREITRGIRVDRKELRPVSGRVDRLAACRAAENGNTAGDNGEHVGAIAHLLSKT